MDSALAALRKFFTFEDFRKGQREIIDAILAGNDTVVVMPTGGGKSLCYQLPAMMKDGITIVVSPLIALMKDQVDALTNRGLPATFINSSIDFEEQKARIAGVRQNRFKLVYVAPERFRSNFFVETLERTSISLFAVDEAHCISTWGHDFRPDYLRLKNFIEHVGRPQILALTATATPYVRSDIVEQLGLRDARVFVTGFDRPNLSLDVIHTESEVKKIAEVKRLSRQFGSGSGIIYTSTRKAVEKVTTRLREARLNAAAYHAGLSDDERARAQDEFMIGRSQMIVATNAFGMGIDKPDIRFVAHYQVPGSIEAYYQEIGRAGRDGKSSACVLLFNYADKRTQDYFIEGSYPSPDLIEKVYRSLLSTGLKRIELSTREIAMRASITNEMAVQSALVILEKAKHIERGSVGQNRALVRLSMPAQLARESPNAIGGNEAKRSLYTLLSGSQINERFDSEIDLSDLADTLAIDVPTVRRALNSLTAAGVIRYRPARRTSGLTLLDESPATLRIQPRDLARRAAFEQRKLREMISFCYAESCYRAFVLDYFGDRSHPKSCGECGNCKRRSAGLENADNARQRKRQTPIEPESNLDRFLISQVPVGVELEEELRSRSRLRRELQAAEVRVAPEELERELETNVQAQSGPRDLNPDETLRVRKILACCARMDGRFGKTLLAATLRGSRSAKVIQAGLDKLSTYGLLSDMTQERIFEYVDALIACGCIKVSRGGYPTVSLSALGTEVMHERASVKLALPLH